jgi:hypothetical protein
MFFPFERSGEVLHTWASMLPELPDELMSWVSLFHFPDAPFVPEVVRGGSFAIVHSAYLGTEAEGIRLHQPIRELGPVMDTYGMHAPEFLGELAMDPPDPLPIDIGHRIVGELPAEAVDALLAAAGPGSGAPLAVVQLRHMGGALSRVAPGAGARATLPGEVIVMALGVPAEPGLVAPIRAAIEQVEHALEPYAAGHYPNFVEKPTDTSRFFDAATWDRLRQVKAQYDPANLFRGNHRIPPAEATGRLAA